MKLGIGLGIEMKVVPVAPLLLTAAYGLADATDLILQLDGSTQTHDGFSLTINGTPTTLTYVNGDTSLVFTTGDVMPSGSTVLVSYAPGNIAGLSSFDDFPVTLS